MLFCAKYHLSEFFAFYLIKLLWNTVENREAPLGYLLRWARLHIGHHISAHRTYAAHHLLLGRLTNHTVILATRSSYHLLNRLTILILLLTLVLQHIVVLLLLHFVLWWLAVLGTSLRLSLFIGALGLTWPVVYLMSLRSLHHLFSIILVVLVVNYQDGVVVLLRHLVTGGCCSWVLSLLLWLLVAIASGCYIDNLLTSTL